MIAIIREQFVPNIANHITRFLEHPTARMIKQKQKYSELLGFDTRNDWASWNSLYGFAQILPRVQGGETSLRDLRRRTRGRTSQINIY